MSEVPETENAVPPETHIRDELRETIDLLQVTGLAAISILKLFRVELSLAAQDTKRILLISLVALPVLFLAWVGLSAMLFWLVYQPTDSIAYGLFAFTALQLLVLVVMQLQIRKYRRSLNLPATRKHVKAFVEGVRHGGTQSTDT